MKIFTSEQIRKADAYTIEHEPIESIDLMERAATTLADWIDEHFPPQVSLVYFAGPGNNGGDAWALARILHERGFMNQKFFYCSITNKLSRDSQTNALLLEKLHEIPILEIHDTKDFPTLEPEHIIIDALFGSGLSRPIDGVWGDLVQYINASKNAGIISIDIPSGLDSEKAVPDCERNIIHADYTLSFELPKLSMFFSENERCWGDWQILSIDLHPDFIAQEPTSNYLLTDKDISQLVKFRSCFSHKGTFGHGLLIAGSYGMMGASLLALRGALRTGAGLITAHVPRLGYGIVQSAVPEALVSIDESDLIFTGYPELSKYTAIGIGPGINTRSNTQKALYNLIHEARVPMVIDADALNILAENKEWIQELPENTILTPHPKEYDRLTQKHAGSYERYLSQIEFSKKNQLIVVLKGAYSCISLPNGEAYFNSTGNPGMATGGSGDVLLGMILSLLAQGYQPKDAAIVGTFIHGDAGDLAAHELGMHALLPSDIINHIGQSFKDYE